MEEHKKVSKQIYFKQSNGILISLHICFIIANAITNHFFITILISTMYLLLKVELQFELKKLFLVSRRIILTGQLDHAHILFELCLFRNLAQCTLTPHPLSLFVCLIQSSVTVIPVNLHNLKPHRWTMQSFVNFTVTDLARSQGCLEKQNPPLSLNLVIWCAKIGPQTKKV